MSGNFEILRKNFLAVFFTKSVYEECPKLLCGLGTVRIITGMDRNAPEWTGTQRNGPP